MAVRFLDWERVQAKALRAEKPHLGDFSWWLEPQVEQNQWFRSDFAMVIGKSPNLYAFVGWRPSMGIDPLGTSDIALEIAGPRKAREEAERQRRYEEFCHDNPEKCQQNEARVGGFVRAVGGGVQVAAGAPMIAAPEPVATKAAGWAAIGRGLDNIATGLVEMWTGESLDTVAHEVIEWGAKKAGATDRQAKLAATTGEILLDILPLGPGLADNGGDVGRAGLNQLDHAAELQTVFRGDRSSMPPEKVFNSGFSPKGTNTDLVAHTSSNTAKSNFISTSQSVDIAEEFAGKNGFVYEIRTSRGVDVNATLGSRSPFPEQLEVAVPDGIPASEIVGAYQVKGGKIVGDLIPNPNFAP